MIGPKKYRIMSTKAMNSPVWKEELPLDQQPAPIPRREAGWLGVPGITPELDDLVGEEKETDPPAKIKKQKK